MSGKKEEEFTDAAAAELLLHLTQESSLPVSMMKERFWGGVPTAMETARVTLWWKRSLLCGGFGICWVMRGRMMGLDGMQGRWGKKRRKSRWR